MSQPTTVEKIILENQRAIMTALLAIASKQSHNDPVYDNLIYHIARITGYIGPGDQR